MTTLEIVLLIATNLFMGCWTCYKIESDIADGFYDSPACVLAFLLWPVIVLFRLLEILWKYFVIKDWSKT